MLSPFLLRFMFWLVVAKSIDILINFWLEMFLGSLSWVNITINLSNRLRSYFYLKTFLTKRKSISVLGSYIRAFSRINKINNKISVRNLTKFPEFTDKEFVSKTLFTLTTLLYLIMSQLFSDVYQRAFLEYLPMEVSQ